jgi:zinc protease
MRSLIPLLVLLLTFSTSVDAKLKINKYTLENGFNYSLIEHHASSEIAIRLLVHVGAVHEDNNTTGYAHFVEHMGFNGTIDFSANEFVRFYQNKGMIFGSHLNAYTYYDHTRYLLSVPSHDTDFFDKALKKTANWAFGIQFNPNEVEKERGIILEERRLSEERLMIQDYRLTNSNLNGRSIIGTKENISSATPASLKAFYKKWYQPNNMELIITGRLQDKKQLRKRIEQLFGQAQISQEIATKQLNLDKDRQTKFHVWKKKSVSHSKLGAAWMSQDQKQNNKQRLQQELHDKFVLHLIQQRLELHKYHSHWPYLTHQSYHQKLGDGRWHHLELLLKTEDFAAATKRLKQEIERVKHLGFTSREITSAKYTFKTNLDVSYYSSSHVANYAADQLSNNSNFLMLLKNPFLYSRIISNADEKKINDWAKRFLIQNKPHFWIQKPNKAPDFSTKQFSAIYSSEHARLASITLPPPLTELKLPQASTINEAEVVSKNVLDKSKVWRLSNGSKFSFTSYDHDKTALLTLSAPGGKGSIPKALLAASEIYVKSIELNPLHDNSPFALQEYLNRRQIEVDLGIESDNHWLSIRFNTTDKEKAFAIMKKLLMQSEFEQSIITEAKALVGQEYIAQQVSHQERFDTELLNRLTLNSAVFQAPDLKQIEQVNKQQLNTLHQLLFGSSQRFSYQLTANIKDQQAIKLANAYLGDQATTLQQARHEPQVFTQSSELTHNTNTVARADVNLVYSLPNAEINKQRLVNFPLMSVALEQKLQQVIREDASLTYNISVNIPQLHNAINHKLLKIKFSCAPENQEKAIALIKASIEQFKRSALPQDEFYGLKQQTVKLLNAGSFQHLQSELDANYVSLKDQKRQLKRAKAHDIQQEASDFFSDHGALLTAKLLPAS